MVVKYFYKNFKVDNHLEPVTNFSAWIRGKESLTLLEPRFWKLPLIGLGVSSPGNVTAEVLVVTNFDDLESKKD